MTEAVLVNNKDAQALLSAMPIMPQDEAKVESISPIPDESTQLNPDPADQNTSDDHQSGASDVVSDMEPIPAAKASTTNHGTKDVVTNAAFNSTMKGHPIRSKGSNQATHMVRQIKYPFAWAYNKVVGYGSVDEFKILFQYLPKFYVIPKESQQDILPMVKKHAFLLQDGRVLISRQDMSECRDSRKWYNKQRTQIKEHLLALRFNKEVYHEIDSLSEKEFGRYLKQLWESGKLKADEEISFQKKIRNER